MSIRTLIEFNHDYIRDIEKNPDQFLEDIMTALREGSFANDNQQTFKVKWTRHHSDTCPVERHCERMKYDPKLIVRT